VGGKGGGGGRGEKWPKPCMHIWIIKEKKWSSWLRWKYALERNPAFHDSKHSEN
jgi:hypothetical protein